MQTYLLIAESGPVYAPIGEVTESEAAQMIQDDLKRRDPDTDWCPQSYSLWERTWDGSYKIAKTIYP